MTLELKLGADPEVFLTDKNGRFVSAHGKFPGTKSEPFKVEKGAVQVDGLALEFNIDPASSAKEFNSNIDIVLKQMNDMVVKEGLTINFTPFAKFDVKYFKEEIPDEAKILGCDPDFSSTTGAVIEKSEDLTNLPFRTAAGHIHIGWTKDEDVDNKVHLEDCRYIADYFRTNVGIQIGHHEKYAPLTKDEVARLKYYGANGAFRPKSYGVELRQYSNLWVAHPERRINAYNTIVDNMHKLYQG